MMCKKCNLYFPWFPWTLLGSGVGDETIKNVDNLYGCFLSTTIIIFLVVIIIILNLILIVILILVVVINNNINNNISLASDMPSKRLPKPNRKGVFLSHHFFRLQTVKL